MTDGARTLKILVADDSLLYRTQMTDLLSAAGFQVLEAEDGSVAVDLAKKELPDLILLDVMMPKMDGYTALMTLKGNDSTKGIPVIMLTTKNEQTFRDIGAGLGAAVYMDKPADEAALLGHIARLTQKP
ncbi:MAG: response regulator [Candidatus Wallbacteria bacterium]|nr:response regulator [Candidatus Wallbacteria bacterium]MBI4868545.1 response regulator [Candidatus Wallbacteria bacterium]